MILFAVCIKVEMFFQFVLLLINIGVFVVVVLVNFKFFKLGGFFVVWLEIIILLVRFCFIVF